MRNYLLIGKYLLIASIIWLTDTALFSLTGRISFLDALWLEVTPGRLIFRLVIVLAVLFYGFTKVLRRELEYNKVIKMNQADRNALYGAPSSPNKSKRLLYYCLRLAAMLKLNARDQDRLRTLCYCYDLGLVNSTNAEKNAAEGAAIAANIPQLQRAAHLIACHNEYYDGSGPRSLFGKTIPLPCRIFSTVLLFDDLLCTLNKQGTGDIAEALSSLSLYRSTRLDPEIVDAFNQLCLDQRLVKNLSAEIFMQYE